MNEIEPNQIAPIAVDKITFGGRYGLGKRSVDNLIAAGLPHLKVGNRRVRIITSEADEWMRERYGTRRVGPAQNVATLLQSAEPSPAKPRRKARQQRVSAVSGQTV
mgnify:CR=1 FL=1